MFFWNTTYTQKAIYFFSLIKEKFCSQWVYLLSYHVIKQTQQGLAIIIRGKSLYKLRIGLIFVCLHIQRKHDFILADLLCSKFSLYNFMYSHWKIPCSLFSFILKFFFLNQLLAIKKELESKHLMERNNRLHSNLQSNQLFVNRHVMIV